MAKNLHGLSASFGSTTKPSGTLIVSLRGPVGVGKTYTALKTIPGPVAYLNGDRDNDLLLERLRTKFKREIFDTPRYVLKFHNDVIRGKDKASLDDNASIARAIRNRFKAEYLSALESDIRYIVIDQSAFVWSLLRIARWGKLTEIPQILYSQANWEMEQVIHQADDTGKVIIWISPSEFIWEEVVEQTPQGRPKKTRRPTTKTQSIGYKAFDSAMTVIGEMSYNLEENRRSIKVIKGVVGMGQEIEGKEVTIPNLLNLATGVEGWE